MLLGADMVVQSPIGQADWKQKDPNDLDSGSTDRGEKARYERICTVRNT